jgi:hypothetical protein
MKMVRWMTLGWCCANSGAAHTVLEIAMLGGDAAIGMLAALHGGDFPYEAIVQVSGSGLACDRASFTEAVQTSNSVLQNVLIAEQQITHLIAQTLVCNYTHQLNVRLARWFARLNQLSGCLEVYVTQEELAALLGAPHERPCSGPSSNCGWRDCRNAAVAELKLLIRIGSGRARADVERSRRRPVRPSCFFSFNRYPSKGYYDAPFVSHQVDR